VATGRRCDLRERAVEIVKNRPPPREVHMHDDLWTLVTSNAGMGCGLLQFGLSEQRRIYDRNLKGGLLGIYGRMAFWVTFGMVGGVACWRASRWTCHRASEAWELGSLESPDACVEDGEYPKKGFDPSEHQLRELASLDFHRLVRSRAFKTRRDAFIGCALFRCVGRVISRAWMREISDQEAHKAIDGLSALWDAYRK
jgi:hypothetical protein